MERLERYLSYSDVYLVPRYSELESRSLADISVEFLGHKFAAPWIPANMSSVIDEKIAKWCSENDYFYIMHRFGDTKAFVEKATKERWKTISISVGVKEDDMSLIFYLGDKKNYRIDYITIDVAHGHHSSVKLMIEYIKAVCDRTKIIVGNVATPEAIKDLIGWGADAVKVGVGGGSPCSTKNQTGFYVPMFSCVQDCCREGGGHRPNKFNLDMSVRATVPIIADGGIKENGDIAKALTAGATMVMCGGLLAACKDAPGENVYYFDSYNRQTEHIVGKKYYGSASYMQKETLKHIEGFMVEIPCNGFTYAEKYQEMKESLQSAISYGGGRNLDCFKHVEWVVAK